MHWLDELPGRLPESIRGPLRGFPTLQDAWQGCPHGPWLLRLAHAGTQDPLVRGDLHDLARDLAADVQGVLDKHPSTGEGDPIALALDWVALEVRAAGDGHGPEATGHRAAARPMEAFDAAVTDWHKKLARMIRERFPAPPG